MKIFLKRFLCIKTVIIMSVLSLAVLEGCYDKKTIAPDCRISKTGTDCVEPQAKVKTKTAKSAFTPEYFCTEDKCYIKY